MTALAMAYIAGPVGLVVGIGASPDHTYRGTLASVNVLLLFAAGLALAIHAL